MTYYIVDEVYGMFRQYYFFDKSKAEEFIKSLPQYGKDDHIQPILSHNKSDTEDRDIIDAEIKQRRDILRKATSPMKDSDLFIPFSHHQRLWWNDKYSLYLYYNANESYGCRHSFVIIYPGDEHRYCVGSVICSRKEFKEMIEAIENFISLEKALYDKRREEQAEIDKERKHEDVMRMLEE